MPAIIRIRHVTSYALLAIVLAAIAVVVAAPPAHARPGGPLVPASGTLLGAYVDPDARWSGNEDAMNEVRSFEATLGRKLAINQHYYAWTNTFPSGLEQWDLQNGRIPLVSWEGTSLSSILSGSHDSMIRARADGLRDLGKPVFLRWGWEMNGNWYPWDGTHNNSPGATDGPSKYRSAWKRIHGIFASRGATNVVWVWSPNNASVPSSSWNDWRNYYPGDAYVDWVGIDGYNWGSSRSWSSWDSFVSLFRDVYDDYAARKPIMIAETSSTERGGDKAAWISKTRSALKATFPSVAAFVWFHVDKEEDWRATSSSSAASAFRSMAADPYFKGVAGAPSIEKLGARPASVVNGTQLAWFSPVTSIVTVSVRRLATDQIVRTLRRNVTYAPGPRYLTWDRRDDAGARVPNGPYRIEVRARNDIGTTMRTLAMRAWTPVPRVERLGVGPSAMTERTQFAWRVRSYSIVTALVRHVRTGKVVRVLRHNVMYAPGQRYLTWNRLKDNGLLAPDGVYQVEIRSRNSGGTGYGSVRFRAV